MARGQYGKVSDFQISQDVVVSGSRSLLVNEMGAPSKPK